MNGYLFNAGVTQMQVRPASGRHGRGASSIQTLDSCVSLVIYGGTPEQAQARFESWCQMSTDGENPVNCQIKRIVAAQFVDQLFTESGSRPLDWAQIAGQVSRDAEAIPVDDFEQGYWVDVNQVVPVGNASVDVESLRRDLEEDIRSGLNWSLDKRFLFLLSVLSPRPIPAMPGEGSEPELPGPDDASGQGEADEEPTDLDPAVAALADLRDKEAAALVEARNSVVAAWLWRKYAAGTDLAPREIAIAPCCSFIPCE